MKIQPSDYWKRLKPQLQAAIVQDLGTRLEFDRTRDANGDYIGYTNRRAVMQARLVDCDLRLVVDVDSEPEDKRLDGLSITAFEGLNKSGETAYAVFRGGRALRLIHYKTTPITDPQEITARELTLARIQKQQAKPEPAKTATADPGELERLRAFSQLTAKDAIRSITSMIPGMDEKIIIAGWLHVKGATWDDMERKTKASRGTLSKRVKEFYRASGLPRNNRRKGIGKGYQLDENRDAGIL